MTHPLTAALDARPDLQHHLFQRGFLITNDEEIRIGQFPLYSGIWREETLEGFRLIVHRDQQVHIHSGGSGEHWVMLGHAYDPFNLDAEEPSILQRIASSGTAYQDVVDGLTGIFLLATVRRDSIEVQLDASGMQYACYHQSTGVAYIASHMRLIGDLLSLPTDDYVRRLTSYRWYHLMLGNYLPGDLTAHSRVSRIIPNTTVRLDNGGAEVSRFYPNRPVRMCTTEAEYQEVISEAAQILESTMQLIGEKWERPAISLTGGIDSNTTFAAANGCYDRFETFSYVSMPREEVDATAAKAIAERFSVPHTTYRIPDDNQHWADFDLYKAILIHNDGEIGGAKDGDTRKKIELMQHCDIDVEVKSWISETVRAYAYKYSGRTRMPRTLRPRHYTSLYKMILLNRRLAHETDYHFDNYLKKTQLKEHLFNYDESDFFVWEMMHGGKCGLNIGVMKFCFDITIPYNNRKLLDLLLRVPLADRISDRHHLDLKRRMNPALTAMNVRVVNQNETALRKRLINAYFWVNTHLPL